MTETISSDEKYFLLVSGTWRDLLPRLPRPVLALAPRVLFRVLVEGSGFVLAVAGNTGPSTGFFTERFVAARNSLEAEKKARYSVLCAWRRQGFEGRTSTAPELRVDESQALRVRFRLRSSGGFVFFGASNDA